LIALNTKEYRVEMVRPLRTAVFVPTEVGV